FDLGGGTFDVTILEVGDELVEVLSTNGDTHLGGDDFDEVLINHIADEFRKSDGIDLRKDPMALQRLREASEKAKKELSSAQTSDINLPFITADATGAKHLQMSITRGEFERLIDPLVERCRKPVENALKDAKLKPGEISEVVLVGGSTRVPKVQAFVKEMFGKEPHKGVNPDEVVSLGAAIQGGIIAGDVKDVVLLDVTPLSLGIETEGGIMTVLVERNTTIPTTKSETFSTAADNQPAVTVRVFQGERKMAGDNRLLDQFDLSDIPPAPRGVPQIEVKFDIDVNGILSVSARDKATGKQHSVQIKQSSGLSDDEIQRMRKDAEAHSEEDRKKEGLAKARNQASSLVHQIEKTLKEHADKLDSGSKSAIEASVAKVKTAAEGSDADAINSAIEELSQASQALYQHMAGAGAGGDSGAEHQAAGATAGGGDDDIIDADFEKKS
ncbi:MAG: molecular chaperone DnaK, partial [Planctomycetaceae bacterium]|nr:molecular chaperone DnaK [Planctomycetaceae bacterium]